MKWCIKWDSFVPLLRGREVDWEARETLCLQSDPVAPFAIARRQKKHHTDRPKTDYPLTLKPDHATGAIHHKKVS